MREVTKGLKLESVSVKTLYPLRFTFSPLHASKLDLLTTPKPQVRRDLSSKPYPQLGRSLNCQLGIFTWNMNMNIRAWLPSSALASGLGNLWNKQKADLSERVSVAFLSCVWSRFLNSYCHLVEKEVLTSRCRPQKWKFSTFSYLCCTSHSFLPYQNPKGCFSYESIESRKL